MLCSYQSNGKYNLIRTFIFRDKRHSELETGRHKAKQRYDCCLNLFVRVEIQDDIMKHYICISCS
jgi:hypothetical protein